MRSGSTNLPGLRLQKKIPALTGWTLKEPVSSLPSLDELYRRWETQSWAATSIDLTVDRLQWCVSQADRRMLFHLGRFSGFFHAEACVNDALGSFIAAFPNQDQRIYVATQIADEARHTMFFDRYQREVIDEAENSMPTIDDRLREARTHISPAIERLTVTELENVTERMRTQPTLEALVDGVTLYHIIIEATIGLGMQKWVLENLRQKQLLPGFRNAMLRIARDESRHIQFGASFLKDTIAGNDELAQTVMDRVNRSLPEITALFGMSRQTTETLSNWGIARPLELDDGLRPLLKILRRIGIEPSIEAPQLRAAEA